MHAFKSLIRTEGTPGRQGEWENVHGSELTGRPDFPPWPLNLPLLLLQSLTPHMDIRKVLAITYLKGKKRVIPLLCFCSVTLSSPGKRGGRTRENVLRSPLF